MEFRPTSDRVLVRLDAADETSPSGLHVPKSARDPDHQTGVVVSIGPGKLKDGKRIPLEVEEGQRIAMPKYSGHTISVDGEEMIVLSESEVLGRWSERE